MNIGAVKRWARTFAWDPNVVEVWLIGSQASGTATSESDVDLVAFVTGELRRLSPDWKTGEELAPGFPASIEGVATHWQFRSVDDFDRGEFERTAAYRHEPTVLLYERARAVHTPCTPGEAETAD